MANRATKSIRFCPLWKAAKEIIMKIKGARRVKRILVNFAIVPESPMQSNVPTTFARAKSQTIE